MIKKKTPRTPHYRHHRPSGQGVVTLNGKDFYLGKFNSPESKEQYDRMIAEWLLNNRHLDKKSVGFEQVGLRRSVSPPLFWNGVLSTHHLPASVAILACSATPRPLAESNSLSVTRTNKPTDQIWFYRRSWGRSSDGVVDVASDILVENAGSFEMTGRLSALVRVMQAVSPGSDGSLGCDPGLRSDSAKRPDKEIPMICGSAIAGNEPRMRVLCWSLIGLAFSFGVISVAHACTSFAMKCKDGLVFGTNFDNDFKPGLLFVNKRGVSKSGAPLVERETPATWTSKYGSVTINTAPYQHPWAGMNEPGLVVSTMALNETQVPPPDNRPCLLSAGWLQYVLDTCKTVDDIIEAERQVRLNYGVDHYLACDATGECLAVEFLEGKPVYHRGKNLPLKAMMFGGPYARYFGQQRGGAASGGTPSIVAGPLARVDEMMRAHQSKDAKADVDYAFRILKGVSAPNTTWSLVFDLPRRTVFIRTYKNVRIRHIDFNDLDFSCRTPVMMLDVHAKLEGNLLSHLQEYSHEATLQHALQSVAYHRPDMTEETVGKIMQHLESFTCTDTH